MVVWSTAGRGATSLAGSGAAPAGAADVTVTGGAGSVDAATVVVGVVDGAVVGSARVVGVAERVEVVVGVGVEVTVGATVGVSVVDKVSRTEGGAASGRLAAGGLGRPRAAGGCGCVADVAGCVYTANTPAPATRTAALARAKLCPMPPATALPVLTAALLAAALLVTEDANVRDAAQAPVTVPVSHPKPLTDQSLRGALWRVP